jgi:hypothetical protein
MGTQVEKPKPRTAGVSALEEELAAARARIRELEQQLAEARGRKPKAADAIFAAVDQFIEEAAIPVCMVGLLYALPNTQLTRRLASVDRLHPDHDGWNVLHCCSITQEAAVSYPAGISEVVLAG